MSAEESRFCEQMLSGCHDWFTDIEVCGSFTELPLDFIVVNVTDIDVLISPKDVVAIANPGKKARLRTRNCYDLNLLETIILVDTDHIHLGLAQLRRGDCAYLSKRKIKMPASHGPARLVNFFRENFHRNLQSPGLYRGITSTNSSDRLFLRICEIFRNPKLDLVFAIEHPDWLDVASAWMDSWEASIHIK